MNYALVTGATSGIGLELTKILAEKGYGLVLVSSSQAHLCETKHCIETAYCVPVQTYQADLSKLGAARELYDSVAADHIPVELLINNAGFGLVGRTEEIAMDLDEQLMVLNTISLVELCKLFLPGMYRRNSGKILNIASTGAFQPGPYTSTYFASKAFVLSYSKAIRYEAETRGVQVCALCPGATKTNFFKAEEVKTPSSAMPARDVAQFAYDRLMENRAVSIPGWKNRSQNFLPESIRVRSVAKMKLNAIKQRQ